jgi:hypothetical protein
MKFMILLLLTFQIPVFAVASQVAITMDDPTLVETPLMSPSQRNIAILNALDQAKIKAALFVCGMRVDSPEGKELLKTWDQRRVPSIRNTIRLRLSVYEWRALFSVVHYRACCFC